LAVLWDFKGLQGLKTKVIRFQIYSSGLPPFGLIPGDITPYSALPCGFEGVQRFAGDCIAGERERVHGGGLGVSGTIRAQRNFDIARIVITGKLFRRKINVGKSTPPLFRGKSRPTARRPKPAFTVRRPPLPFRRRPIIAESTGRRCLSRHCEELLRRSNDGWGVGSFISGRRLSCGDASDASYGRRGRSKG
jgi:hypothetical protein